MIVQLLLFIFYDDIQDITPPPSVRETSALSASFYAALGSACGIISFSASSLHGVEAHGRLGVADAAVAKDVVGVVEHELLREDVVEVPKGSNKSTV